MLKNIKDSLEIAYKQGLESDDNIYIKGQIKDWEEMLSNIKHEQELKDNALKMYDEGQQEIERLNNGLKDIKWYIEKNKTSFSDLYIPASDVVSILVIIDRLLGSDKE